MQQELINTFLVHYENSSGKRNINTSLCRAAENQRL